MHRRPFLFKACVFVFAASAAVMGVAQAADSKLDSVLARGKLIVGTGSTNAPWHFQGADGKLQGFGDEVNKITSDQKRLRENIEALSKTPEAKTLIERYIAKAGEQETQLEEMEKQRKTMTADKEKLEQELAVEIKNFEVK